MVLASLVSELEGGGGQKDPPLNVTKNTLVLLGVNPELNKSTCFSEEKLGNVLQ